MLEVGTMIVWISVCCMNCDCTESYVVDVCVPVYMIDCAVCGKFTGVRIARAFDGDLRIMKVIGANSPFTSDQSP